MRKYGLLSLVITYLLFSKNLCSQITSTAGTVHACAPASITYTAPAGATSISWNFGPFGTSALATGGFNVGTPTNFNAVFSGVVNGGNVTFTVPVFVHAKPTASFSISQPANPCVVKTVTLTDLSSGPSALQSWFWSYGDGGSGTSPGTHTYGYTLAGNYSVTLKVTDIYGCDNQVTIGTVNTINAPIASISSNPPSLVSCNQSLTASFSGSNSAGSGLTYNWNFGNSQSGTGVSPSPVTFSAQSAPYVVTLTVTAGGCSSTASAMVIVSPPTLSVSVPATVCLGLPFTATVLSNQPVSYWNLGNSTNSTYATPNLPPDTVTIPAYTTPGYYTLTISAGSPPCMTPLLTKVILVEQVIANYTTTPVVTCNNSVVVTYTNLSSTNAVNFSWSYVDWQGITHISSQANPTFTFAMVSNNPYTTFPNYFPTPVLIAISAAGCVGTSSVGSLINLQVPTATYASDKSQGCVPLTVTFTNTSIQLPLFPIISYTWNNGANPSMTVAGTGTPPPQPFTYTATGTYTPFLSITTASGCTDVSYSNTITVVNPPAVNFSFSPTTACANQSVQIVNLTPGASTIQQWHIQGDNGFFSGCVSDPNPAWIFNNVGVHTLTMTGALNGCSTTAVSAQTLTIKGPKVTGRFETNCTNRKSVIFYADLQEVQNGSINFGDGNVTPFTGNPSGITSLTFTHVYLNTGDYTVIISGTNTANTCPASSIALVVNVRDITANFVSPTAICVNTNYTYTATGSLDVYTVTCDWRDRVYLWYFDNLPPSDSLGNFEHHTFTTVGIHTISLYVKDINNCTSTLSKTISVTGPSPSFSFNSNPICLSNGTVQITNTTPQLPHPITNYQWNFGNGQFLTTTSTTVPVQTYTFANPPFTMYNVILTATNSIGCVNSTVIPLQVSRPDASFYLSQQNMCLPGGNPLTVTITSVYSYPTYTYNFGVAPNATLVTSSTITTFPYGPGTYTLSVTVMDVFGCVNTDSKVINATQTPTANFTFSSPGSTGGNSICSPNQVTFSNTTLPAPGNPEWNLATGVPILPLNVVTQGYSSITNSAITISLKVNTGAPNYCQSMISKSFTIYVAKADIALNNSVTCLGGQIRFSIDTTGGGGVRSWVWDYGDASPSPTVMANSGPPSFTFHTYNFYPAATSGNATVSLLYYSAGDACRYFVSKPIRIIKTEADFKRNNELTATDTVHCIKIEDRFHSVFFPNNSMQLVTTWTFPGGKTITGDSAKYTFTSPGPQQVTLTVKDANFGCQAIAIKNLTIHPLPTASISSGEYCPERPFPITASLSPGAISGTWSPSGSIVGSPEFTTGTGVFVSTGVLSVTSQYFLNVTDTNNCVSETADTTIKIILPPKVTKWDTMVVIGQPIPINGNIGNFTYTWTPVIAGLSCTNCPSPVSSSTDNITYYLSIEDLQQCAIVTSTYNIIIEPKTSVDVPEAFTPNGDGVNDIIYVDGWGLRNLNFFRIFNRWGQLIFESNDLSVGWDGTFQGVPQNMETYVYQVSVDTWVDGRTLYKTSTLKLLR
jgi:gliding motility-associated-like protein